MALAPKLEIRQKQALTMTARLREAINLLQLNNVELSQLIETEIERNPFLEKETDFLSSAEENSLSINDLTDDRTIDEDILQNTPSHDYQTEDFGSDAQGYENQEEYSWTSSAKQKLSQSDEDFDYIQERLQSEKSVYRLIEEQIENRFIQPKEKFIAHILAQELDECGYIRADFKQLANKLKISKKELESTLFSLQKFEPSGIFARNLQECLKIQLQDNNQLTPKLELLLQNLELVGAKKINDLKKICNCSEKEFFEMLAIIKTLNPKPLVGYGNFNAGYIVPDVIVKMNSAQEFFIELNPNSLPKVLINNVYCKQISSGNNKEAKKFLKNSLSRANFIIKSMHQRANTILSVSEEIIKHQKDFFHHGVGHLRPLQLKDIALQLDINESTVSRIINGKYMQTPRGTFELKYFFSNAAFAYSGEDNLSTTTIKAQIKQLIEKESPDNILSDDKLVEIFAQKGVKIARRTITKYREQQNIPTSAERKRQKRKPF